MRCTKSYMPATVTAIWLLAMVLDVRAQQQIPGETYTAGLLRPWICDSYAERQQEGDVCVQPSGQPPLADPSSAGGDSVSQLLPPYAAIPPTLGVNFAGTKFGTETYDSVVKPADTMGAVGPNHFMEVVNGNVSVFMKSDGSRVASESLESFFRHINFVPCSGVFDPRVLFDQHSGRWIVVATTGFTGTIALAVSQSDDPMGTFCKTSFIASAGLDASLCVGGPNNGNICTDNTQCPVGSCNIIWPDYPTLGVDVNGIYIGADMDGGSGSVVWAIEKGPLIVDPPSTPSWGTVTAWRQLPGGTSQPAHTYGTPGSEYIIAQAKNGTNLSFSALRVYRVEPPLSAPTMTRWTIPVQPFGDDASTLVPALDSTVSIRGGVSLMMSVYRDGSLWTTHNISLNGRWGIRWYQIDPPGASAVPTPEPVIQWGNVGHDSLHFYMPSLMVNRAGHVTLGFSGSDASTYVGAYYTGRRASDAAGDMAVPRLLKAGEGPYSGRWGDYSNTTLDPVDESTIWTIQEYAAPLASNNDRVWGTWIAALGPFGICNDNNGNTPLGNSPLVCVDWDSADPPIPLVNFNIDTISDLENPNATLSPNVTFVTGNDGWKVWSQVTRTDATQANLGHIGMNPLVPSDDFGVTVAHGALPGAANVASISLVKEGWTGQSSLTGGRIAGDLTGDLVLQGTPGQNGAVSFTIDGNVTGSLNIPTVDYLKVHGDIIGELRVDGLMSGEICAANFCDPPNDPCNISNLQLPPNIHMARIDSQGTICGTPVCASAQLTNDPGDKRVRSIAFSTTDPAWRAIGVKLTSLHHVSPPYTGGPSVPFETFEGQTVYVGPPATYVESAASQIPFTAAFTQCTPHYANWNSWGLLHVTGSAIVPSSQYEVQIMPGENAACAATLSIPTNRWGDIESPYNPPSTTVQPDVTDIGALANKFRNAPGAPIKARALIAGAPGNPFGEITAPVLEVDVGFQSISAAVNAFRGVPYPYKPGKCAGNNQACIFDSDCVPLNEGPCKLYCPEVE